MAIAKVIEVTAEAPTIEQAVQNAVAEAGDSVRQIRNVYLRDTEGIVENGRVDRFRVNTKITFMVEGSAKA